MTLSNSSMIILFTLMVRYWWGQNSDLLSVVQCEVNLGGWFHMKATKKPGFTLDSANQGLNASPLPQSFMIPNLWTPEDKTSKHTASTHTAEWACTVKPILWHKKCKAKICFMFYMSTCLDITFQKQGLRFYSQLWHRSISPFFWSQHLDKIVLHVLCLP